MVGTLLGVLWIAPGAEDSRGLGIWLAFEVRGRLLGVPGSCVEFGVDVDGPGFVGVVGVEGDREDRPIGSSRKKVGVKPVIRKTSGMEPVSLLGVTGSDSLSNGNRCSVIPSLLSSDASRLLTPSDGVASVSRVRFGTSAGLCTVG